MFVSLFVKKLYKFIIPSDSSITDLLYIVRKRVNLDPEQALYIYVNTSDGKSNLLSANLLLSNIYDENKLSPEVIQEISNRLAVEEKDVISMNQRLSGKDHSLNAPRNLESGMGDWQENLMDQKTMDQEGNVSAKDELTRRKSMLGNAITHLNEREKQIFASRRLTDSPRTLEELSVEFNISRERVRQIEVKAFEKVQQIVKELSAINKSSEIEASNSLPPVEINVKKIK